MASSAQTLPSLDDLFRCAVTRGAFAGPLPGRPRESWTLDYAQWRFLKLLQERTEITFDHGVLLRQVARWAKSTQFVGTMAPELVSVARACGVAVTASGTLVAAPYTPSWLEGEEWGTVDGLDQVPEIALPDEQLPGEPWLQALPGIASWQSAAQKEACWQALTAPAGGTTLLGLPTGAGKSLAGQLLARFSAGVTVVVVPTTALAIDQSLSAQALLKDFPTLGPRAYAAAGADSDPAAVRAAIQDGSCRLLFTSPEACVSGSLRQLLDDLAKAGRFDNLVVDEAHIIDSWGGHFRVDFQFLALRRRQWLALSGGKLRTLLLSATFTPKCMALLKGMFGGEGWQEFACQRLRPEIVYWRQQFVSEAPRDRALLEALHFLPRPLIVYTTEVDEAKRLHALIDARGFTASRCFHGDTPAAERRNILTAWRRNEIEVIVATSAFGMGVDKGDVRAVVHACFPETVHRYYQEVGRGGRDKANSIALLLPTTGDEKVAEGLLPKMLGAKLTLDRWASMLAAGTQAPEGALDLPMNAKRQDFLGARTYGENIRWNKRLILMLARSGLVDLIDLGLEDDPQSPDARIERIMLKPSFPPHDPGLADRLKPARDADIAENKRGIAALRSYLSGAKKICRLLRHEYGDETIVACGGCPACRDFPIDRHAVPPLDFDRPPVSFSNLEIVLAEERFTSAIALRRFSRALAELVTRRRARHFIFADALAPIFRTQFGELIPLTGTAWYRLDQSSEAPQIIAAVDEHVLCVHGQQPDRGLLNLRIGARTTHIFPADAAVTDANGRVLLSQNGASYYPNFKQWIASV